MRWAGHETRMIEIRNTNTCSVLIPSFSVMMCWSVFSTRFFISLFVAKFPYKVKVKLSLCFNWAPRHEGVLGEWKYSSKHSWPRH